LVEQIKCLESDVEEVELWHDLKKISNLQNGSYCQKESLFLNEELSSSETLARVSTFSNANELTLKNLCQLESDYVSMRFWWCR